MKKVSVSSAQISYFHKHAIRMTSVTSSKNLRAHKTLYVLMLNAWTVHIVMRVKISCKILWSVDWNR